MSHCLGRTLCLFLVYVPINKVIHVTSPIILIPIAPNDGTQQVYNEIEDTSGKRKIKPKSIEVKMEVRLPRPTEIAVRVEMPSSKEPEIKTEVIEVLETDQSQPGHYPTIRTTTIKPPDSTADATSIEGSKASNTYKKWIRESTETDIVDKLQTNMQRRGKSKKIKREEPNTFSVTMTYEQEREIVIMAVLYKEQEYSDYALMAIKWWIKGNHTDEFEKHEKYDDWRTCFIKCKKVKYWMKIYNDCGEHRLYGKPRGTRSEPITFRPYLTYDDESKIIQKAIDIKDWFCPQNMNRRMGVNVSIY